MGEKEAQISTKINTDFTDREIAEMRAVMGQAIVAGLLSPVGIIATSADGNSRYAQNGGSYWQDGGTHSQTGGGDYHQQTK